MINISMRLSFLDLSTRLLFTRANRRIIIVEPIVHPRFFVLLILYFSTQCYVNHCLFVFCPFSVDHCFVCPPLNYGFRLTLWYLQTFLYIILVWFMVHNTTFNNISVISRRLIFIGGGNRSTRRKIYHFGVSF